MNKLVYKIKNPVMYFYKTGFFLLQIIILDAVGSL